jgi:hypothetical protein
MSYSSRFVFSVADSHMGFMGYLSRIGLKDISLSYDDGSKYQDITAVYVHPRSESKNVLRNKSLMSIYSKVQSGKFSDCVGKILVKPGFFDDRFND